MASLFSVIPCKKTPLSPLVTSNFVAFLCCLFLMGCDAPYPGIFEQEIARPQASSAYLVYYGPPPATGDQNIEALVGYLPVKADHALVAPFPLFITASSNHLQHLAQRMIDFEPEMAATMGLVNPFPAGTRIQSFRRDQDGVSLELSHHAGRQSDPQLRRAMAVCLVHALTQFRGIKTVSLSIDGLPVTEGNRLPYPNEVIGPGQPKLLGVSKAPADDRQEQALTLYFDRPVKVRELHMLNEEGTSLQGTSSDTLYGMAVEMRPQQTLALHDGERIRVSWEAVDALGTHGEGDAVFYLRVQTQHKHH